MDCPLSLSGVGWAQHDEVGRRMGDRLRYLGRHLSSISEILQVILIFYNTKVIFNTYLHRGLHKLCMAMASLTASKCLQVMSPLPTTLYW